MDIGEFRKLCFSKRHLFQALTDRATRLLPVTSLILGPLGRSIVIATPLTIASGLYGQTYGGNSGPFSGGGSCTISDQDAYLCKCQSALPGYQDIVDTYKLNIVRLGQAKDEKKKAIWQAQNAKLYEIKNNNGGKVSASIGGNAVWIGLDVLALRMGAPTARATCVGVQKACERGTIGFIQQVEKMTVKEFGKIVWTEASANGATKWVSGATLGSLVKANESEGGLSGFAWSITPIAPHAWAAGGRFGEWWTSAQIIAMLDSEIATGENHYRILADMITGVKGKLERVKNEYKSMCPFGPALE